MERFLFWLWAMRHLHSRTLIAGRMGRVFCYKCGASRTFKYKK